VPPRPPPTDAEIADQRARAEAARRAAEREDQALAELLEAAQERLRLEIARLRGEGHESILHDAVKGASVNRMEATATKETRKRLGRPPTAGASKHPFVKRAIALHGSLKAAAAALKRSESTLQGWYTDDPDRQRTIPEDMIELFEVDPWNIPRRAWRRK
jgi:hypothetical protein